MMLSREKFAKGKALAYRIAADTLRTEVENNCDGHPAWDSILGDEELWDVVEAQLKIIVTKLDQEAKEGAA